MLTASELKMKFLEIAEPILQEYVGAALGTSELKSTNAGCRAEVWDLMKQLILKASDTMRPDTSSGLEITCTKDITKFVKEGKLTVEDGKSLLSMYKMIAEIDSLGSGTDRPKLPVLNITLRDENGERKIERSER